MIKHTVTHLYKGYLALLALCYAITTQASWVESSGPFKHQSATPKICAEIVLANTTPLVLDTTYCLDHGSFEINSKYLATDENGQLPTLMKLDLQVGSLDCKAKIKRTFDHKFVDHHGEIQVRKAGWKVIYVNDCEGKFNTDVLKASIGDKNVKKLTHQEYLKLPKKIRDNLSQTNLLSELGEDDYRYLQTHYYKILDNDNKTIIGILENSSLQRIGNNTHDWYLVRYNHNGNRLGEIE